MPMKSATTERSISRQERLPGLPTGPLTPEQQEQAIARLKAQAEQRIKIGVELLNAADTRARGNDKALDKVNQRVDGLSEALDGQATQQQAEFEAVRSQVQALRNQWAALAESNNHQQRQFLLTHQSERHAQRQQTRQDIDAALVGYEQRRSELDRLLAEKIKGLESRLDGLESVNTDMEGRLKTLAERLELALGMIAGADPGPRVEAEAYRDAMPVPGEEIATTQPEPAPPIAEQTAAEPPTNDMDPLSNYAVNFYHPSGTTALEDQGTSEPIDPLPDVFHKAIERLNQQDRDNDGV